MRGAVLALAVALLSAGCTATKSGYRTIGGPTEAGGQQLELKVRGVDLARFSLSLAPQLLDGNGQPISSTAPPPVIPGVVPHELPQVRPATVPAEIPDWLVRAADAGDRKAMAQLAAWTLEAQRRGNQ